MKKVSLFKNLQCTKHTEGVDGSKQSLKNPGVELDLNQQKIIPFQKTFEKACYGGWIHYVSKI